MLFKVLIGVILFWAIATVWANYSGKQKVKFIKSEVLEKTALLVYNPDPIYNLDEQVCESFANGLMKEGFSSKIATIDYAEKDSAEYDLYVFCANTYNWAPDWSIMNFIKTHKNLEGKNVVGIMLGSGSTQRAERILKETIEARNCNLIDCGSLWLMRPNDVNRMEENNSKVAVDLSYKWGKKIVNQLNKL